MTTPPRTDRGPLPADSIGMANDQLATRGKWEPTGQNTCAHGPCAMTLTTPIGGGLRICWLHALQLGLRLVVE